MTGRGFAVAQEPYNVINLFDWTGGIQDRRKNPLAYPLNALTRGENVDITDGGLRTRRGMSVTHSDNSIPNGPIRFIRQIRFPTNESSYLLVQSSHSLGREFTKSSPFPGVRHSHSAVWDAENGRMIVFGGASERDLCNDLWTFTPETGQWLQLNPTGNPPTPRSGHTAVLDPSSGRMYVFGGREYTGDYLNDTHYYDMYSNSWQELEVTGSIPPGRSDHTAVLWGNAIVVAGGRYSGNTWSLTTHYVLSLDTAEWQSLSGSVPPDQFVPSVCGHAAVRMNDIMYVIAGCKNLEQNINEVWALDLNAGSWSRKTNIPQSLDGLVSHRAVICGGSIICCGGVSNEIHDFADTYLVYDIATDRWSSPELGADPGRRLRHSAVTSDDGKLIIFGGIQQQDPQVLLGDLWYATQLCTPESGGLGLADSGLYASSSHLPTSDAQFAHIYALPETAGVVSVAVLGDRAIVTEGIEEVPLVFLGGLSDDGSDWAFPLRAFVSYDGIESHEISQYVLDSDTQVSADVGGIRSWGHIFICCDVPRVSGFYIEMNAPNEGNPDSSFDNLLCTDLSQIDETTGLPANIEFEDLKSRINYWVADGIRTGHFERRQNLKALGAIDNGDGTVGIPCENHGFLEGDEILLQGTAHYDNTYVLPNQLLGNEDVFVITREYVAETFSSSDLARMRITLGCGNIAEYVESALLVSLEGDSAEHSITSIKNDGAGDNDVTLSSVAETGKVTKIYGLRISGGYLTIRNSTESAWNTIWDRTEAVSASTTSFGAMSLRIVVSGAELSAGVDRYVKLTFRAGSEAISIRKASIVERSGNSANGIRTPTPITFQNRSTRWINLNAGQSVTCDGFAFQIDPAKDYLICLDVNSSLKEVQTLIFHPEPPNGLPSLYPLGERVYTYWRSGYFASVPGTGYYWAIPPNTPDKLGPYRTSRSSMNLEYSPGEFNFGPFNSADGIKFAENVDFAPITFVEGVVPGLIKIEASTVTGIVPSQLFTAVTKDDLALPVDGVDSFNSMWATIAGDQGLLCVAFSWKSNVFSVFDMVNPDPDNWHWKEIVKEDSGTWQYKNASGSWQTAQENTVLRALKQAFGIAANRQSTAQLAAMTSEHFTRSGGFVPGSTTHLGFAVGLEQVEGVVPQIRNLLVSAVDYGPHIVEAWKGATWQTGAGWDDNTRVGSTSLAQTGTITYRGNEPGYFEADYHVFDGIPGFWFRIKCSATSPGCSITRIKYRAPCQPLRNIGDGKADSPLGFVVVEGETAKVTDYTVEVSDYTETEDSAASIPLKVGDFLYIGYLTRFNEISLNIIEPNTEIATLSAEYWNGLVWSALNATDASNSGEATLSRSGKIIWHLPTDWRQNIAAPGLYRGYWIRLSASADLSASTAISECRVCSVPDALVKHKYAAVFQNRVALAGRPDALDQIDITAPLQEYAFTGYDTFSYRVGGMDGISSLVSAWNSLLIGKATSFHQLRSITGSESDVESIEAARHVPVNAHVVVKAPAGGFGEGDRYALFFINRYGAFVSTGLHVDAIWNTGRGSNASELLTWWDGTSLPRLDLENLHIAWGEYWPEKNWVMWTVPMIVSGEGPQTTNNRLIVFDLSLQAWLPPFTLSLSSLATAAHYSASAPGKIGSLGLYAGDYKGRVLRLFGPNDLNDAGEEITAWVETGWFHFGSPEYRKILRLLSLYGKCKTGPITVSVYCDGEVTPRFNVQFHDLSEIGGKMFALEQEAQNVQGRFYKFRISFTGPTDIYGLQLGLSLIREWGA
ncbi:hypothetical protein Desti_3313 [Desulfomonile tiedjei DSM 6799]|uniref:Kelch motif protein n=2 Tax=Desulfomonile tiedjei TaxID=2358 RepID=I4C8T0_DESTA|nr:hypothetical protein Desti_3313 [Desulfomonile tiedjei DSM 6799]